MRDRKFQLLLEILNDLDFPVLERLPCVRHTNDKEKALQRATWAARIQLRLASSAYDSHGVLHALDKLAQPKWGPCSPRSRLDFYMCFRNLIRVRATSHVYVVVAAL